MAKKRLTKPDLKGRKDSARKLLGTGRTVLVEALKIGREMLRIPAGLFMRAAEAAGAFVLMAWHILLPLVKGAWRLAARAIRVGERELTPLRATVVAAVAAALLLFVSQFADYTATTVGTSAYDAIGGAPAPEVESASAGSSHAWLGLPLAIAALVAVGMCAAGNRRAGLALVPIGLAVVAMSLLVDLPKGTDEGGAALAYESVRTTLQGGFWGQLACGVVLAALGPLLSLYGRSAPRGAPSLPRRRGGKRRRTGTAAAVGS